MKRAKNLEPQAKKKKNKIKEKDLQLKEGVKKNRMGFRSNERKQERGYLKQSI